jgi:hypothetical protein
MALIRAGATEEKLPRWRKSAPPSSAQADGARHGKYSGAQ